MVKVKVMVMVMREVKVGVCQLRKDKSGCSDKVEKSEKKRWEAKDRAGR